MTRDSGAADFVTNDGAAGRTVAGTLSAVLGANEVVQVSFDGGATWSNAATTGTSWTITDGGAHNASWTIQARVINTTTSLSGTAASQLATLDTTPPVVPTVTSQTTSDTTPTIQGTATLGVGETLSVTVNGATYDNVPVTNGVWRINTETATPSSGTLGSFANGSSYPVTAVAKDVAGNSSTDTSTNELAIKSVVCPFDPFQPDNDGDGLPNALEAQYGRNAGIKDNDVFGNYDLFVNQLYRDIHSRESEQAGYDYWKVLLKNGTLSQFQVIEGFYALPEFNEKAAFVIRAYQTVLDRSPDFCGFNYWMAQRNQGKSMEQVASDFLGQDEFVNLGPLSNQAFVDRMLSNAELTVDAAQKTAWVQALDAGTGRSEVLFSILQHEGLKAVTVDEVAIDMLYLGFLNREDDQPGWDHWHQKWANGEYDGFTSFYLKAFEQPEFNGRFVPIENSAPLTLVGVPEALL